MWLIVLPRLCIKSQSFRYNYYNLGPYATVPEDYNLAATEMADDAAFMSNSGAIARSLLVALCLNWGLQGVLCTQVYTYYLAFPRDRLLAKLQVYGVLTIEIIQTVVVTHDVFAALGTSPGDLRALDSIHTHWFSIPVSGGITGCIGQLFFAFRIWKMSAGSKGPTVIICILALASGVSALVAAVAFFNARTFTNLMSDSSRSLVSIGVWNGIGAICDMTIALSMPYFLMRNGTGLRTTHTMIVKLVRLIIEIGGLTAIVAILHLCLYFANNEAFLVPGLTVSKLYANTMLVILNNRLRILDGRILDRVQESSDSPSFALSEMEEGVRSRSTIIVSNDRLTFRFDDSRERHLNENVKRHTMPSHVEGLESSTSVDVVEAKNDAGLIPPSTIFNTTPNTKI
ncbi:hypothetical protein B0H34DRAFT_770658 [Crassisporium funariophilum]|nr:hypothetical protein B0H34DRAFT_770658 [Crassisporium funariophilum]